MKSVNRWICIGPSVHIKGTYHRVLFLSFVPVKKHGELSAASSGVAVLPVSIPWLLSLLKSLALMANTGSHLLHRILH